MGACGQEKGSLLNEVEAACCRWSEIDPVGMFCRLKTDPGVQLLLLTFRAGEHRVISMEMLGKIRRMYYRDMLSLHQICLLCAVHRNHH